MIAVAHLRHRERAVDYWNGLREIVEWWDDAHGSYQDDPWQIAIARELIGREA
jgi:hypothetical protein